MHVEANYVAVLVAAIAAFILGWLWYSPLLFYNSWMRLRGLDPKAMMPGKMPGMKLLAEFVRCFVLAFMLAQLFGVVDSTGAFGAIHDAFFLWVTFPVLIFWGFALWQDRPWGLIAIDAGDWLVKLIVIAVILDALR